MSDTEMEPGTSERFRRVADAFTAVVEQVDDRAWTNPSPCQGWTARDVVAHLVEWIPSFLGGVFDFDAGPVPDVNDDPSAAWATVRDAIQAGLDNPDVASSRGDAGPLGELTFDDAVAITIVGDVFIHTWDLAQAAGIDVNLDVDELDRQHRSLAAISPDVDAAMRNSGHYGPRIAIRSDAEPLDIVLGFFGRQPTEVL